MWYFHTHMCMLLRTACSTSTRVHADQFHMCVHADQFHTCVHADQDRMWYLHTCVHVAQDVVLSHLCM